MEGGKELKRGLRRRPRWVGRGFVLLEVDVWVGVEGGVWVGRVEVEADAEPEVRRSRMLGSVFERWFEFLRWKWLLESWSRRR